MSEQTFGQKAVGLSFNPSNLSDVDMVKRGFAEQIDILHELCQHSEDPEIKRLCSVAITETQTAQMWAVKALTWKS